MLQDQIDIIRRTAIWKSRSKSRLSHSTVEEKADQRSSEVN